MRVYYSDNFFKHVEKFDHKQQAKLARLIVLLKENPFQSRLHTKSLSGNLSGLYSFRVKRDLRVLFKILSADEIILVNIGHRKDIYR